MESASRTSLTLLESLQRGQDETVWRHFDALYRPIVTNFALRLGLQAPEAEDAAQRTIIAVSRRLAQNGYDRKRGRFRNWLLGIAKFEIADVCAERARQPLLASQRSGIEAILENMRDPESFSDIWEQEHQKHMIGECFKSIRAQFSPRDVKIFEMLTIRAMATAEVAKKVGLSPPAVRQVKHQVLQYMRSLLAELDIEL